MTMYFATVDAGPRKAFQAWLEKREAWDRQVDALGKAFNAKASQMFSGSRLYVGGIKVLTDDAVLDRVHWREDDEYGYSMLRSKPKLPKGDTPRLKTLRSHYREAHADLLDRWGKFCPDPIDSHDMWKGIGLVNGGMQFSGMQAFLLDGVLYIAGPEWLPQQVQGAQEILGSVYNQALAKYKAGEGTNG